MSGGLFLVRIKIDVDWFFRVEWSHDHVCDGHYPTYNDAE